jgi:hypothetical protein
MKGIYLTEEGKKEIEDLIAKLTDYKNKTHDIYAVGQIYILKQILSSATILPVEESWEDVELYPPDNESQMEKTLRLKNGVIIQSKQ